MKRKAVESVEILSDDSTDKENDEDVTFVETITKSTSTGLYPSTSEFEFVIYCESWHSITQIYVGV